MALLLAKATTAWLVIAVLAILNAGLREGVLVPALGPTLGLSASGVTLSILILGMATVAAPWFGHHRASTFWLVGAFWAVLTLAFEFGLGRLVQGKSWSELLAAYTFEGGNLWLLVMLVVLVAPWAGARTRGRVA